MGVRCFLGSSPVRVWLPSPRYASVTVAVARTVAEGIAGPLAESFTLAAIWDDLCRHAREVPPEDVRRWVEGAPVAVQSDALVKADDLPGSALSV